MIAARHLHSGNKGTLRAACTLLQRVLSEESGQDLIEYALVFSFVALGAIASMKSLSTTIAGVFASVGTTLTTAT